MVRPRDTSEHAVTMDTRAVPEEPSGKGPASQEIFVCDLGEPDLAETGANEPNRRDNELPGANANRRQAHSRIGSFRRQLVTAFCERAAPSRHTRPTTKTISVDSSRAETRGNSEQESAGSEPMAGGQRRPASERRGRLENPRHLIRMFAERRNDSSVEGPMAPAGDTSSLMNLLVDMPTRAANCLKPSAAGSKPEVDHKHLTVDAESKQQQRQCVSNNSSPARSKLISKLPNLISRKPSRQQSDQMSKLISTLNELTHERNSRNMKTKLLSDLSCINARKGEPADEKADGLLDLEESWTSFVRLPESANWSSSMKSKKNARKPTEAKDWNLRLQQEAIWELVSTEVSYIKRLKLIVDLFLVTLDRLQEKHSLLVEIESELLASNISQVLEANLKLWSSHFRPTIEVARLNRTPIEPSNFLNAFIDISELFKPYYRYCTEQVACISYIREQKNSNECFKVYLAWCESQKECERLRLSDLLAHPMQRLTRYPLLLKTIAKRSSNDLELQSALSRMIAHVDKFVLTVDLELKRQNEFNRLINASRRLQSIEPAGLDQHSSEIQLILRSYNNQFDLMAPLFNCEFSCPRQLIFDSSAASNSSKYSQQLGQIRFKDAYSSSKLDVVVLIFTDQLLVCRQTSSTTSWPSHPRQAGQMCRSSIYSAHSMHDCHSPLATIDKTCANSTSSDGQQGFMGVAGRQSGATTNLAQLPRQRAASHSFVGAPDIGSSGSESGRQHCQHSTSLSSSQLLHSIQVASSTLSSVRPPICRASNQVKSSDDGQLESAQEQMRLLGCLSARQQQLNTTTTPKNSSNSSLAGNQHLCHHYNYHHYDNYLAPADGCAGSSNQSSRQSGATTCDQFDAQYPSPGGTSKQTNTTKQQNLRSIRAPFPIERLVMHELEDGLGVLFCHMNDSNTIANSFVLYCSRRVMASSSSSLADNKTSVVPEPLTSFEQAYDCGEVSANIARNQSAAGRLIHLVKQAQVRYRMAAQFHGIKLAAFDGLHNQLPFSVADKKKHSFGLDTFALLQHHIGKSSVIKQREACCEFVSAKTNENGDHSAELNMSSCQAFGNIAKECNIIERLNGKYCTGLEATQMLKESSWNEFIEFAMEQHQLSMLSHGKHDQLARNYFNCALLSSNNEQHFIVTSSSISSALIDKAHLWTGFESQQKDSLLVPNATATTLSDDDDIASTSVNSFSSQLNLSSSGGDSSRVTANDSNILFVSPKRRNRFGRSLRVYRSTNQTFQLDVPNADMNIGQVGDIISDVSIQTQPSNGPQQKDHKTKAERNVPPRGSLECTWMSSSGGDWEMASGWGSRDTESQSATGEQRAQIQSSANCSQPKTNSPLTQSPAPPTPTPTPNELNTSVTRRHLMNSLRRQNVILSQLSNEHQSFSAPNQLHPFLNRPPIQVSKQPEVPQPYEPSLIDKAASSFIGERACKRLTGASSGPTSISMMTYHHESSSLQATSADQTFDDSLGCELKISDRRQVGCLIGDENKEPRATSFELGDLRLTSHPSAQILTNGFRSASAEVRSPISVTLTRPINENHKQTSHRHEQQERLETSNYNDDQQIYPDASIHLSVPSACKQIYSTFLSDDSTRSSDRFNNNQIRLLPSTFRSDQIKRSNVSDGDLIASIPGTSRQRAKRGSEELKIILLRSSSYPGASTSNLNTYDASVSESFDRGLALNDIKSLWELLREQTNSGWKTGDNHKGEQKSSIRARFNEKYERYKIREVGILQKDQQMKQFRRNSSCANVGKWTLCRLRRRASRNDLFNKCLDLIEDKTQQDFLDLKGSNNNQVNQKVGQVSERLL